MDMLGADDDDYSVTLETPFVKEQWEVSVVPISTRYADRERTKDSLVNLLRKIADDRPGNYLYFFPSYEYMNGIYEAFMAGNENVHTLLQTSDMSEGERESFLGAFDANTDSTLIGF